jgi:hypothetical protein
MVSAIWLAGLTVANSSEESRLFLTASEVAALLRISPVTLSRWRIEGCGPPFRKFGRRVLYSHGDLLTWAETQRRWNTSAPPNQ